MSSVSEDKEMQFILVSVKQLTLLISLFYEVDLIKKTNSMKCKRTEDVWLFKCTQAFRTL